MAVTSPDNIVYPSDYSAPADVPNAMQANSNSVQTALNKRAPIALTMSNIPRTGGWHGANPTSSKAGRIVYLEGLFVRDAALTVVAADFYLLGTLQAAYRPTGDTPLRVLCPWGQGGVRRVGHLWIYADGALQWSPGVSGSLVVGDWVSMSGLTFVAA